MSQFKRWYDYAGTPEVSVHADYDAAGQRYTLTFAQHIPDTPGQTGKPPLLIPVSMGLLDAQGNDLPLRLAGEDSADGSSRVLELTEREQSFSFVDVAEPPVPSLLRGFSAPIKLSFDYRDEELMFLMAHDSDGFNRWDAAQTLAQRVILTMVAARDSGLQMAVPEGFLAAFGKALADQSTAPALLAEVLTLPAEGYLGDQMSVVDVDGIHAAREALRAAIGERFGSQLLARYDALAEQGEYRPEPEAIGRRSLKNLCLSYLMAAGGAEATQRCLAQYRAGHNMTDVMAALAQIADSALPERAEVLADFDQRWRHDPLVMDKWFSVQAMAASRATVLDEIRVLMGHPAFSIKNPNKVRALIGAFAAGNPRRFNAADGSGYQFLADRILDLDALNPQIASRLTRNLSRWQRYDDQRQAQMRAALERLAGAPGVSKDVYEIASKSLKD
jgi:aminopeptidase N